MAEKRLYNHNDMKHWKKYIYYPITFLRNSIISTIPSRHFRRLFDKILGVRIGKNSFLFRRTEVLFPKGLLIKDYSTIGWFTLLDARGGIQVGDNVTIASYVKLITGSHDFNSPDFDAIFLPIVIGDYSWICTGATICQGVKIGEGAVVAAGAVVVNDVEPYTVVGGVPAKKIGVRNRNPRYKPSTPFLH